MADKARSLWLQKQPLSKAGPVSDAGGACVRVHLREENKNQQQQKPLCISHEMSERETVGERAL